MKRIVSFVLALVLVVMMLPIQESFAAEATPILLTKDGVSGYAAQSAEIKISTASFSKLFVITLDSDSLEITNKSDSTIAKGNIFYLNGEHPSAHLRNGQQLSNADLQLAKITNATVLDSVLPENSFDKTCTFYYCLGIKNYAYVILIQIKEKTYDNVDKTKLKAQIDRVMGDNAALFYQSDDRFNGHISDVLPSGSYWASMQSVLKRAQEIYNGNKYDETAVDNITTELQTAVNKLILKENVNATTLYEALHVDWCWYYNELRLNKGTPVSKENCTALTWEAYAQAKIDGQALLDELYDADGNPTEANTFNRNDEVNAAAAAADGHKLVNKDAYKSAYEAYRSGKAEAEALIQQYDPKKLTAEDYSAESWKAFTDAYAALKADLDYRIVGGSTEDYAMLKDFTQHVTALKNTRKQLISDKDITISFTYLNNFSAQFENFRENGTNLYVNAELGLTKGNATLADAIKAAGMALDKHDDQTLPGGAYNNSDTAPWFMLFVNGSSYGLLQERLLTEHQVVQLHNGDVVRLVRICQPLAWTEASTGYDSTAVTLERTYDEQHYRDSIAKIDMNAPAASKVGAKTAVSATVTGANATNLGKTLNPKNVTLFISAPAEEETLSQPIYQTTATTDESGNLQYVFREPG